MNRLAVELSADIPQGDVDGGDRLNGHSPAAVVNAAAIHAVPEPLHFQRILPHDQRGEPVEALHPFFLAPARRIDAGLRYTGARLHIRVAADAGVGCYLHQTHVGGAQRLFCRRGVIVEPRRFQHEQLDARDFHPDTSLQSTASAAT